MSKFKDYKWEEIETGRIEEILRQAELRLADQLNASFARDQRASTMLNVLTTVSVASLGAAGSMFIWQKMNVPLFLALLSVALWAFWGAWNAMKALKSGKFHFSGNEPISWLTDEDLTGPWSIALSQQAKHYHGMIRKNEAIAKKTGKRLNKSIKAALYTPIIFFAAGVLAWMVTEVLACVLARL